MSVPCLKRRKTAVIPVAAMDRIPSKDLTVESSSSRGSVTFSRTSWAGASCHGTTTLRKGLLNPRGMSSRGMLMVEIVPKTGFLHQIRVTLAHLGHPVLGDRTYAPHPRRNNAGQTLADRSGAQRHMLHAAEVQIFDVHAVAPVAADFERCRSWLAERASGAATASPSLPEDPAR